MSKKGEYANAANIKMFTVPSANIFTFENSNFAILGFWNYTRRVGHWSPNNFTKKGRSIKN